MTRLKPGQAADLVGVSVDTVRRWTDEGVLASTRSSGGQRLIDGADLARFMREHAAEPGEDTTVARSARNRFPGIVTAVRKDGVMAQVDIQAGPHRVVSLMSPRGRRRARPRPRRARGRVGEGDHVSWCELPA